MYEGLENRGDVIMRAMAIYVPVLHLYRNTLSQRKLKNLAHERVLLFANKNKTQFNATYFQKKKKKTNC